MPAATCERAGPRRILRVLLLNSARKYIGEAAHAFDLCGELRRRGHTVMLGARGGFALDEECAKAGTPAVAMDFHSGFSPIADWRDIRAIGRILRDERIDIVHCHRGKDHWLAAAARALYAPKVRLVRTRHVVTPARDHVFNRWLYGRVTDALISVSQQAQDGMGALMRVARRKPVAVIYSSVDSSRFHPGRRSETTRRELGAAESDRLIGLIARFQNIKGQHIFLRAASTIAREFPEARFLLAGRGGPGKARRFAAMAREHGIADRLIILGHREDLPDLMAALDIGVSASLGSEGSSRIALEYFASGVPLVATRVGSLPELTHHGELADLVDPDDPAALAAAIAALLRDPARRAEMARRGREAAERDYSRERWIREIEEVYEMLVEAGAR